MSILCSGARAVAERVSVRVAVLIRSDHRTSAGALGSVEMTDVTDQRCRIHDWFVRSKNLALGSVAHRQLHTDAVAYEGIHTSSRRITEYQAENSVGGQSARAYPIGPGGITFTFVQVGVSDAGEKIAFDHDRHRTVCGVSTCRCSRSPVLTLLAVPGTTSILSKRTAVLAAGCLRIVSHDLANGASRNIVLSQPRRLVFRSFDPMKVRENPRFRGRVDGRSPTRSLNPPQT